MNGWEIEDPAAAPSMAKLVWATGIFSDSFRWVGAGKHILPQHVANAPTVAGVQWETDAALLGSVPVEHHSNQPPQLQASGWKTIQPEVSLLDDGHPLSTFWSLRRCHPTVAWCYSRWGANYQNVHTASERPGGRGCSRSERPPAPNKDSIVSGIARGSHWPISFSQLTVCNRQLLVTGDKKARQKGVLKTAQLMAIVSTEWHRLI